MDAKTREAGVLARKRAGLSPEDLKFPRLSTLGEVPGSVSEIASEHERKSGCERSEGWGVF